MSGFSKKNPLIRRVLFQNVSSNVLLIKEIFDEVAVGSRFVLFEVKILILLQEQLKIRVTTSDDQICFLFIVNIEKIKIIPPPTTFPPIHRPRTQRLTESLIIFERLQNRNIFILQNTNTAGRAYNYTSAYYPKRLLVSIKHIRRSLLYLFSSSKTLMRYSSPDTSKFICLHGFFFSSYSQYYIVSYGN